MTQRLKSTWWVTQKSDADIADATLTALPQITVYAENSSRTFRSCGLFIHFSDQCTATGATIGEHRAAWSVAGAGATTFTELDDISSSAEQISGWLGPFDMTAHFVSNFPAADSTTLDLSVYFDRTTGTGLTSNNIGALLFLTYEFNDTDTNQYATAIIPMESLVGALGTSEAEIGTSQIPQITGAGGMLENLANVVALQEFVVAEGNDESGGSSTDYAFNSRIDTGTTQTKRTTEKGLASDSYRAFIHIESPSLGASHAWKAWTTGAGRLNHCAHTLYLTYEWTPSGTTRALQSVQIPFEIPSPMGGTAAADRDRFQRVISVPEPGTITLKQSAVRLHFVPGAGAQAGLNVAVGGQADRAYTNAASVVCGGSVLQQRIDSGGAQGAGMTLARGENTITVNVYRTDGTDLGWNISGVILLNYTSDVDSDGAWAHNHTVYFVALPWDAALTPLREASAFAPVIPEAQYWLSAAGFFMLHWDAAGANGLQWAAEVLAGEGAGDGWRDLYTDIAVKDSERSCQPIYCRARDDMMRWPLDPDADRMDIEASRKYRYANAASCAKGVVMMLTYHSIVYSHAGDVDDYLDGDGSGLTVETFRTDTGEKIGEWTTVAGGGYTVEWYFDTVELIDYCQKDADEYGASAPYFLS